MSEAARYADGMEETATPTKSAKPFYVEVEWRDWGGKWPHDDDPDQILKQVLRTIITNAKSQKWIKENVKVTVYRDRQIFAYHDPDEAD